MTLDELKQEITQRTGVPAVLLTGETAEENIAQAKAFIAYKREVLANSQAQQPKTAREEFIEWTRAQSGEDPQDQTGEILAEIEERARIEAGGYPIVNDDGGEFTPIGDTRPAVEQFKDWVGKQRALDPFRNVNVWHHI